MAAPGGVNCNSCAFFSSTDYQSPAQGTLGPTGAGVCKRFPPIWYTGAYPGQAYSYIFPVVLPDEFCGEWKSITLGSPANAPGAAGSQ